MQNMSASRYTDKHIFEQEQHTLFRRHWQLFCHKAQLKDHGDYVSGDVAGMAVMAIRGSDGELRAFLNVCRHRGARLLEPGTGNCDTLRCPYHNWTYQTTGVLKHAPWFGEDESFRIEDWPLQAIKIEVWRNLVFIAIDPVADLSDQLGATLDELTDVPMEDYNLVATKVLVFDANWKNIYRQLCRGLSHPGHSS